MRECDLAHDRQAQPAAFAVALAEDATGGVWALDADHSHERGVIRYEEQSGWTIMPMGEGSAESIRMAESAGFFERKLVQSDRHGNVWVGSRGGLSRFDGRGWTHLASEDVLPVGTAACRSLTAGSGIGMILLPKWTIVLTPAQYCTPR